MPIDASLAAVIDQLIESIRQYPWFPTDDDYNHVQRLRDRAAVQANKLGLEFPLLEDAGLAVYDKKLYFGRVDAYEMRIIPRPAYTERWLARVRAMRDAAAPIKMKRTAKGQVGRRGYPLKVLQFAQKLREKDPSLKVAQIRAHCVKQFPDDDVPADVDAFRTWLNRKRTNRTN